MEFPKTGNDKLDKAFQAVRPLAEKVDKKTGAGSSTKSNPFGIPDINTPSQPGWTSRLRSGIEATGSAVSRAGEIFSSIPVRKAISVAVERVTNHLPEPAVISEIASRTTAKLANREFLGHALADMVFGGGAGLAAKTGLRVALGISGVGTVNMAILGAAGGAGSAVAREYLRQRREYAQAEANSDETARNALKSKLKADRTGRFVKAGLRGAAFGAVGGVVGGEISNLVLEQVSQSGMLDVLRSQLAQIKLSEIHGPDWKMPEIHLPEIKLPFGLGQTHEAATATITPVSTPTEVPVVSTPTAAAESYATASETVTPTEVPVAPSATPTETPIPTATAVQSPPATSMVSPVPEATADYAPKGVTGPDLSGISAQNISSYPSLEGVSPIQAGPSFTENMPAGAPDLQHAVPASPVSPAPAIEDSFPSLPAVPETPAMPEAIPLTAVHGHIVSGSVIDGDLTYDGKPWEMLENGTRNIDQLFQAVGESGSVNHDVLGAKLQEATNLWVHGELNPSVHQDLYKVFHLSNGTASIYNSLLDDETLESLVKLGIVTK